MEGRLPAFRIGQERYRRFRKEDLDKVLLSHEETQTLEGFLKLPAKSDPLLAGIWNNDGAAVDDRR
jgi:hypothetical protein